MDADTTVPKRCHRHPHTRTSLSCGRCTIPICPRCLVHTDVGIRCPKCAPPSRPSRAHLLGWLVLLPLWRAIFKPRLLYGLFATATALLWIIFIFAIVTRQLDLAKPSSAPLPGDTLPGFPAAAPVITHSVQPSPTPPLDLALLAAACTGSPTLRITTCEGSIRNLSTRTVEGVQVVIEWLDDQGAVQATNSGPIDYNPLLPGQESPWTLLGSYNPGLTKFMVSFRGPAGPLRTRDDR